MISRIRRAVRRAIAPSFDALVRRQHATWAGPATFALTFDVETAADCEALPTAVDMLRARQLAASFACIGALVEHYPTQHRALVSAGHELMNHTHTHPWHEELGVRARFDELDDAAIDAEIANAQRRIAALGTVPVGFRAPHFGVQFTPRAYVSMRRAGLRYSSSTGADRSPSGGAPYWVDGLVEIPLLVCPDHPDVLLDSWHCTTAPNAAHRDPTDLLRVHRRALDTIARHDAFGAIYWDPRVLLTPPYEPVLDVIASKLGSVRLADVAASLVS